MGFVCKVPDSVGCKAILVRNGDYLGLASLMSPPYSSLYGGNGLVDGFSRIDMECVVDVEVLSDGEVLMLDKATSVEMGAVYFLDGNMACPASLKAMKVKCGDRVGFEKMKEDLIGFAISSGYSLNINGQVFV